MPQGPCQFRQSGPCSRPLKKTCRMAPTWASWKLKTLGGLLVVLLPGGVKKPMELKTDTYRANRNRGVTYDAAEIAASAQGPESPAQ